MFLKSLVVVAGLDLIRDWQLAYVEGLEKAGQEVKKSLCIWRKLPLVSTFCLNQRSSLVGTMKPLLDKITGKMHSWTVKYLSFAGMVNFWSAAFVLPKAFYAKVVLEERNLFCQGI